MLARSVLTGLAVTAMFCASGCGLSEVDVAKQRSKFLLTAEPEEGVQSIPDVREELKGEQDVVLIGRVGGTANPWTVGRATFLMVDPASISEEDEEAHAHHHHKPGEECPFCAKAKEGEIHNVAQVQFCDDRNELLPIDARQLFADLKDDSMVVVKGRARVNEVGKLVVNAKGLYVRK